ncbi:MAG: acyltransferase [Bacteroidales bacterium]|jgi:acetyltransferase-like isoleucine patch superfamily enzyme|nr:acyltransferase [Bacteroidales bacterium]
MAQTVRKNLGIKRIICSIRFRVYRFFARRSRPMIIMQKYDFQGKRIHDTRISTSAFLDHPETLYLSDHIYIGHYSIIEASNTITIEEGCQIGFHTVLASHSSHNSIRLYGKHYSEVKDKIGYVRGSIHIGKYTFVGPYSLINPNTTIGKGSIIAAYSSVRGHFPDYSIIAGNPATVIGSTKDKDLKFLEQYPELKEFYYDND